VGREASGERVNNRCNSAALVAVQNHIQKKRADGPERVWRAEIEIALLSFGNAVARIHTFAE
jgi:hypothetical protein